MTANTMREAFEKWYLMQRVSHASHLKQDSNGCYFGAHTETAWKAWQAAQSVPECDHLWTTGPAVDGGHPVEGPFVAVCSKCGAAPSLSDDDPLAAGAGEYI